YYTRSRKIPWLAKEAFETRDWPHAIELSQERISIFSVSISNAAPIITKMIGETDLIDGFWDTVEEHYQSLISERYEADLALAYLASMRRRTYQNIWNPIGSGLYGKTEIGADFLCHFTASGEMTPELVQLILAVPGIKAPFRDLPSDAVRVSERMNTELQIGLDRPLERIEVVNAGFFRNRGAYIVGSVRVAGEDGPLALALLHREDGIEVDAVILRETTLRHIFSSTLANQHVTVNRYHELVEYLHGLMPVRPRGMHYSTIGYNHVGKLAVMEQITTGLDVHNEALDDAPGPPGSVAIGFTSPSTEYVLKIIRDKPTKHYKWGEFHGKESVLAKYHGVHEKNRSGSMLDNVIYSNLWLPRKMFKPALLDEILQEASDSVSLSDDDVFFSHLIVQRKLVPVPLYLQNCTREEAEMVVIRLGQCIRNNAATNVFNRDLDGRNYGVSSLRFVYLFDYDAVEVLTDVKVRTNTDLVDGEEGIPDWYFEDGVVFLPEEIEAHLRLPDKELRRLFREAHGEMLTVDYWTRMQRLLKEGYVPRVRTYPRSTQLIQEGAEGNLTLSPQR
ncbi:MAG: bifunctional isocitrate dehydrogenase kinase/phosphatase, partial [Alphaproteobacteria bacterium]|nr:bifunctional isocitrate dehydrogenase kinase/phosphatase [Alphaproteobacteria bacterium]